MTKAIVVGAAEIQLRAPVDKVKADLTQAKGAAVKSADDAAKAWLAGMNKLDGAVEKTSAKVARAAKKKSADEKVSADMASKAWADGMYRIEQAVNRLSTVTSSGFKNMRARAVADAKGAADAWANAMKRIEGGMDRMSANQGAGDAAPGITAGLPGMGLVGLGKGMIASLGGGLAAKEIIDMSDAWVSAKNKIASTGVPLEEVGAKLDELTQIAIASRATLESTVSLYARLGLSAEELGLSQEELLTITEATQKALAIGGASTSEAASATRQFAQALGSGALRGDEFNSIMENAPIIAQAIAKEFGVSTSQLRAMAEEGELSSERVAEAMLNAAGDIEEAFNRSEVTVAQSATNMMTSLTSLIGKMSEATGAAQLLANTLGGLGWFFERVSSNDMAAETAEGFANILNMQAIKGYRAELAGLTKDLERLTSTSVGGAEDAATRRIRNRVEYLQQYLKLVDGGMPGELPSAPRGFIDPSFIPQGDGVTGVTGKPRDQTLAEYKASVRDAERESKKLEDSFVKAAEKLANLQASWRSTMASITAKTVDDQADRAITQLGQTIDAENRTIDDRAAAKEDIKLGIQEALWEAASTGDWAGVLEASAQDALRNAFMNATDLLADLLADILLDIDISGGGSGGGGVGGLISSIVSSLFGGGGGEGGGWSALGDGFASGGYTGGMRGQPAGIVHGEEFVFDADSTSNLGVGNLTALQNGFNPWQPTEMVTGPDSGSRVANSVMNVSIDATGADAAGLRRVEAQLQELNRTFTSRVVSTAYEAQQRGFLAG